MKPDEILQQENGRDRTKKNKIQALPVLLI